MMQVILINVAIIMFVVMILALLWPARQPKQKPRQDHLIGKHESVLGSSEIKANVEQMRRRNEVFVPKQEKQLDWSDTLVLRDSRELFSKIREANKRKN